MGTISNLEKIVVHGARVHNLKNINIEIPRNSFVVFTGISGSGKSSLAFDTIYAEGQRRFVETLSPYARQFIGGIERPDVDKIEGLSPSISIEQKTISHNPRSTVGTVTEIYDFLRLLFAKCGIQYSPDTNKPVTRQNIDQIFESIYKNFYNKKVNILSPLIKGRKGHYKELFEKVSADGFSKVRVDKKIIDIVPDLQVERFKIHDIEAVVDRVVVNEKSRKRIYNSLEIALRYGNGVVIVNYDKDDTLFNEKLSDPETGRSFSEPTPNAFSFNSPYGWCTSCYGLGEKKYIDPNKIFPDKNLSFAEGGFKPIGKPKKNWLCSFIITILNKYGANEKTIIKHYSPELMDILLNGSDMLIPFQYVNQFGAKTLQAHRFEGLINYISNLAAESNKSHLRNWAEDFMSVSVCETCKGGRLKEDALWVRISGKNIHDICLMSIEKCKSFFEKLKFNDQKAIIAKPIITEIINRLNFLINVGLSYLTLDRTAKSLSGGEAQRIKLATQIGTNLTGVLYILDEPSIGLHQRDNLRLIQSLKKLRDQGNSIIVVEHDRETIENADFIVDLGPGAGEHGGQVVAAGALPSLNGNSLTIDYIRNLKTIKYNPKRRNGNGYNLVIHGARGNNLKNLTVKIPLGKFVCVTGVSGSGKSTLINDTLYKALTRQLYNTNEEPLPFERIEGITRMKNKKKDKIIDKVIEIDQSPIGRTPRSNPATYTGLFTLIRNIFASLPESKIRGYSIGRFSFNVSGGRCETCQGDGLQKIEMNFLPDIYVTCEVCHGRRYNSETLAVLYKGKSIADVLDMTVEEALTFFSSFPAVKRKLQTLSDVGLGYIKLGQQATTLSGGEAQRVKLATELSRVQTGKTIYILDEPTTGLHFEDINMLLNVLNKLVDRGNTVIVIEHNLDVIKCADWIIDLGPEGGDKGGYIIAEGTPEQLVKNFSNLSYTAKYLQKIL